MKKTVIIGGVATGASCAARLRRLDESAEIVLLERGSYISYANCGLPYHVGDVIKSRETLLVMTAEDMKRKFNVDVRVSSEAVSIDAEAKNVSIKNNATGETYTESYDNLVIATGSSPLRPGIPGIESDRIKTLWTVPDADIIKSMTDSGNYRSVAVIGGGFIGLEMAENLHAAGLNVTIIEAANQVMAPLDFEMAQVLHENINSNGAGLILNNGVKSFDDTGDHVNIRLTSGDTVEADLVILSIGVRPNSSLAREAGLLVGQRGGIFVDKNLRTSDPNIFAGGDVIEVEDLVSGGKTMIPLAGPANKQGRIIADNIAGADSTYKGSQGTSVAKVFDLTAASTGVSEKKLISEGKVKGRDFNSVIITQNSHAGYYPGAMPMTMKVIFTADGSKILGAQIVGLKGVDKRIDTLATAIRLGAGVQELTELELAYAPPFSSAKDPVNMAGFTAQNVLEGKIEFCNWNDPGKLEDAVLLDVREEAEVMAYSLTNAINIPFTQIRKRIGELDPSRKTIVFCAIGVRSYNVSRFLMQNGFKNILLYPGGTRFYQSTHHTLKDSADISNTPDNEPAPEAQTKAPAQVARINAKTVSLDCSGLSCPGPIMKVFETMQNMQDGQCLKVTASDPGFLKDIESWCRRTGNTLIAKEKTADGFSALLEKGLSGDAKENTASAASSEMQKPADSTPRQGINAQKDGKTMVVFSGDLDKVLASFIIANGAAAMGRPVTMFFTFWGLTALRKEDKQHIKKTPVESMFGTMLPRGSKKLKLSKMNMGGMGTAMMKKIMKDKNIDSLEDLIKSAIASGVKIVACTMSMDVMGIKPEELIDGVELGGVGAYLGDAEESDVNLFI